MEKTPCIAMLPCPGLSHLIPLVEFAKRLVQQHHEFHVTLLIPTIGPPNPNMKAILNTLPPKMDYTILHQVNMEDLPQNVSPSVQIILTIIKSLPFLHEALNSLSSKTNLVALVFDLFSIDALDIAKQLNLSSYVFFSSAALTLSFCLSLPKLDESVFADYDELENLTEPVTLPGSSLAFHIRDLPEPVLSKRSSETYKSFLRTCQRLRFVDGIILNTFMDLEGEVINALQEREANNPSIYPVGPIIQSQSSSQVNGSMCIKWLEKQPRNSVVYVSFGSGGTLSQDQLNELAYGLEMSGHQFLWIVRPPNQTASSGYLSKQNEDPLQYLPQGFLDRTEGQGLVVPSWAPQIEVLSHESTGSFLTHCGWNSTLESVVHGVPLIAWPLFAEQKMNAIMLTDLLKVAVRPKGDGENDGIVKREEIAKVIKRVMDGGDESLQMRTRMKGLSVDAVKALSEDGSCTASLSSLALKWQGN